MGATISAGWVGAKGPDPPPLRTTTLSMSQKLSGAGRERVSHVVDLCFKIRQKGPEIAILGVEDVHGGVHLH